MYRVLQIQSTKPLLDTLLYHEDEMFVYDIILPDELSAYLHADYLLQYTAIVINYADDDPLLLVSRLAEIDQNISIYILCSSRNIEKVTLGLKVTPYASDHIYCVDLTDTYKIDDLVLRGVHLTERKRNLSALNLELDKVRDTSVWASSNSSSTIPESYRDSRKDLLTGLMNRQSFLKTLSWTIDHAQSNQLEFSLLEVDVDNFHFINETYSEEEGNKVLIIIANLLIEIFEEADAIARLGSDEFIIFFNLLLSEDELQELYARLASSLKPFLEEYGANYLLTVSAGGYIHKVNDKSKANDILRFIHSTVGRVKGNGGNGFLLFDKNVFDHYSYRMMILNSLSSSLEKNDFSLVYQPVIDINNQSVFFLETLVRWTVGDTVYIPSQFIPVLESEGVINRLDDWIFNHALKQFNELKTTVDVNFGLSINVSPDSLRSNDAFARLTKFARKNNIPESQLFIEVTETRQTSHTNEIIENISLEEKTNFKYIIDDFGDGYSQLKRLIQLPIYCIKIDKSFVGGIGVDDGSEKMIKIILSIGETLGAHVVAEGVETSQQLDFLTHEGCCYFQGEYFFKAKGMKELLTDPEFRRYIL